MFSTSIERRFIPRGGNMVITLIERQFILGGGNMVDTSIKRWFIPGGGVMFSRLIERLGGSVMFITMMDRPIIRCNKHINTSISYTALRS